MTISPRLASININFDSLNEAYGFPVGFTDRCFFQVAERFLKIADKHGFKYTLFVVGRDLENGRHREAVREWVRKGHEVGNHSWSHHMNLGAIPAAEMSDEISRSHEAIALACGVEPKGFISPAWSCSDVLWDKLLELGYLYDTSSYPSWLLTPMVLRIALGYRGTPKAARILDRKDWLRSLVGSRQSETYKSRRKDLAGKELIILPLPTTSMRLACWHTTGFMFGWDKQRRMLDSCLRDIEHFYYLAHPGDLIASDDLDPRFSHSLARIDVSLDDKIARFEEMIERIIRSPRKLVPMEELAYAAKGISVPLNGAAQTMAAQGR